MENIVKQIKNWHTTGTNSKHDPYWKEFVRDFKKTIKKELEEINVENIVFSVGHYYISGFFQLGEQNYYFSISDVRHFSNDMMMVRTAKDFNDYRGGSNNWIKMEKGLFRKFFNIN